MSSSSPKWASKGKRRVVVTCLCRFLGSIQMGILTKGALQYFNMTEEPRKQVWKYLPHIPSKKTNPFKRKSEVTDKQVLNLTGGLFPVKLVDPVKKDSGRDQPLDHWVRVPIVQKNNSIGPIYHWTKQGEEKKLYHGEKFNVETPILNFTAEQFNSLPLSLPDLTFPKARSIFDLLQTFNLNFVVVHDRIQPQEHSIQELKQIYFTISRELLKQRSKADHPLATYQFDMKYESNRKYELQKYLMRNKVDTQRQKSLLAEIRRLQILIKKEEREQINLKRALKMDDPPEQIFQLEKMHKENEDEMKVELKVFSRQQYLGKALNLPGKINQRLQEVLQGMNIPEKITATEENVELYDKLRQKVLLMFSIQRYIRKKEGERRNLEERKKRLNNQEEEDRAKGQQKPGEQPKKRMHLNKPS